MKKQRWLIDQPKLVLPVSSDSRALLREGFPASLVFFLSVRDMWSSPQLVESVLAFRTVDPDRPGLSSAQPPLAVHSLHHDPRGVQQRVSDQAHRGSDGDEERVADFPEEQDRERRDANANR